MTPGELPVQRRAAVYARYSSQRVESATIEDQVRRCVDYAKREGHSVVAIYADAAITGSHMARPEMLRLLSDVARSRGKAFDYLLVDDLSRLSRDLYDLGRIVFTDLARFSVPVVDVMTNTASNSPNARQLYAAMGISNELFLANVRSQTHRGMVGRAMAGYAVGGKTYGYRTQPADDPASALHPRKEILIDPLEAEVVRGIFRLYAEGQTLTAISRTLNAAREPAPTDRFKIAKTRRHGWSPTTILNCLRNERYIGRWVWNKRKAVPIAGGLVRQVPRPREEWIELERRELAIIDPIRWEAVQDRLRRLPKQKGKQRDHTRILFDLLRCRACGKPVDLVGGYDPARGRTRSIGCISKRTSLGRQECSNTAYIPEWKLIAAIGDGIRKLLVHPELVARFVTGVQRGIRAAMIPPPGPEPAALAAKIVEVQRRVLHLTDAIARNGYSSGLSQRLQEDESYLRALHDRQQHEEEVQRRAHAIPPANLISAQLGNPLGLLMKDPGRGRLILKKHLSPFVVHLKTDGARRWIILTGLLGFRERIGLRCSFKGREELRKTVKAEQRMASQAQRQKELSASSRSGARGRGK